MGGPHRERLLRICSLFWWVLVWFGMSSSVCRGDLAVLPRGERERAKSTVTKMRYVYEMQPKQKYNNTPPVRHQIPLLIDP